MSNALNIIGIGKVIEDSIPGNPYIKVIPLDHMSLASGDVTETTKIKKTFKDATGKVINLEDEVNYVINAKWLPLNCPNRLTPPNVVAGQSVLLMNFHGVDEYFYITMFTEYDIAKKEEVSFILSNKEGPRDNQVDDLLEATYRVNMSTLNKQIQIKTSDNNGELTTYEFLIDTLKGKVFLEDGKQNLIYLDSETGKLLTYLQANLNRFITEDNNLNIGKDSNTLVKNDVNNIYKKDVNNKITGNTVILSEGDIKQFLDGAFELLSKNSISIISKGEFHIEARQGLKLTGSTDSITIFSGKQIDITAPMVNINSPSLNVTGVVMCGGLSMGGAKPGDVTPPIKELTKPDLSSLDDIEKYIEDETKYPVKEEEESNKEEKKEQQQEPQDPQPNTPDTNPGNQDANMETNGNITIKSKTGTVTIGATGTIEIKGTGKVVINGTGMDIGTSAQKLDGLLESIVMDIADLFTSTATGMTGPTTNPAALTAMLPAKIAALQAKVKAFKGI